MEVLESSLSFVLEKMMVCEFYAHIYKESLKSRIQLASKATTDAFTKRLDNALKELYVAIKAFVDKAHVYFERENSGMVFFTRLGARMLIFRWHAVVSKMGNLIKPFSVTMEPLMNDIMEKEKIIQQIADMATMNRILGTKFSI